MIQALDERLSSKERRSALHVSIDNSAYYSIMCIVYV